MYPLDMLLDQHDHELWGIYFKTSVMMNQLSRLFGLDKEESLKKLIHAMKTMNSPIILLLNTPE